MSTFNVLITGTKAGIGYGLLEAYAARPNTIVVAAIRDDPSSEKAKTMVSSVTKLGQGSRVIPVKYDAGNYTSAHELVEKLSKNEPDIKHLDLVVANAGYAVFWGPFSKVPAEELNHTLNINLIGPVMLYQATRDLLLAASGNPKFVAMSTAVSTVDSIEKIPFATPAYSSSKNALNFFAAKANHEEDRLTVLATHPGWIKTDMGDRAAKYLGMEEAPGTLEESVTGLLKIFDTATKEHGKQLQSADGRVLPW